MGDKTSIEWTDASWNPLRGCSRISLGCGGPNHQGGCYAEKIAARFSEPGQAFHGFAERTPNGGRWTGKVALIEDALTIPLRWKKPRRIFVNSMSDLFHEALSDEDIDKIFAVMALAPQHQFQVLTKRSDRMRRHCANEFGAWPGRVFPHLVTLSVKHFGMEESVKMDMSPLLKFPLANVSLGISVEDQAAADERIPDLVNTPAAKRFLSVEPMIGPVDLHRLSRCEATPTAPDGVLKPWLSQLDLVICGGESGPRSRTFDIAWARFLRDHCKAAGVYYFQKQLGAHPIEGGVPMVLKSRKGGDPEEWPEDLRVREAMP